MSSSDMKLCTFNVNGLGNAIKRKAIFKRIRREAHTTPKVQNMWAKEWEGSLIMSHGSSNSRGVAILFKKGLEFKVNQQFIDANGRIILGYA